MTPFIPKGCGRICCLDAARLGRDALTVVAAALLLLGGCKPAEKGKNKADDEQMRTSQSSSSPTTVAGNPIVVLRTTKGDIVLEVFQNDAPNLASNFLRLVKSGFYDNLTFYRVLADSIVEAGDPTGTGYGNPGYDLEPESTPYPNMAHFVGMVPMADGRVNGSRFYILLKDASALNEVSRCFARVIGGIHHVVAISRVPAIDGRPLQTVKIMEAYTRQASPRAN